MEDEERAREQQLDAALTAKRQAYRQYGDLLTRAAGIDARKVFPTAQLLTFRLSHDVASGVTAMLMAAHDADGRQLWHVDVDEEWPDESLVTDWLAAAAESDGYFRPDSNGNITIDVTTEE